MSNLNINKQQAEQLSRMCQWILSYDDNLPNRDGKATQEVVDTARQFSLLNIGGGMESSCEDLYSLSCDDDGCQCRQAANYPDNLISNPCVSSTELCPD